MDARRDPTAGTLGDILALRAKIRGAAGIVTDGAARDAAAVAAIGLPVYTSGQHPAVLGRRHVPWETRRDHRLRRHDRAARRRDRRRRRRRDGHPAALVDEVLAAAEQQEREEAWIAARVAKGAASTASTRSVRASGGSATTPRAPS